MRKLALVVLALVVAISGYLGFAAWSTPRVKPSRGIVSISLSPAHSKGLVTTNSPDATLLAPLLPIGTDVTVKFEPSGTHLKDGYLFIRLDVYVGNGSMTYPQQYVDHYARELTQEEMDDPDLAALVPTYKALNPAVCIFFKIYPDIPLDELFVYLIGSYDRMTLTNLDYILAQPKSDLQLLSLNLRGKTGNPLPGSYSPAVIDAINNRLAGLQLRVL
jgi:hypothetical protein